VIDYLIPPVTILMTIGTTGRLLYTCCALVYTIEQLTYPHRLDPTDIERTLDQVKATREKEQAAAAAQEDQATRAPLDDLATQDEQTGPPQPEPLALDIEPARAPLDDLATLDEQTGPPQPEPLALDIETARPPLDGQTQPTDDLATLDEQTGPPQPADSPIGRLLHRPAFNKTRSIRFLSVRRWRKSTKDKDLELFKFAKEKCDPHIIKTVAGELAAVIEEFMGRPMGSYVTAPPPGASAGRGLPHFATLLAQETAAALDLEFILIFKPRPRKESSNPWSYDRRGELQFITDPPTRNCLLIDDVATSGNTIEQCANALKSYGPVTSIVWIYGRVK